MLTIRTLTTLAVARLRDQPDLSPELAFDCALWLLHNGRSCSESPLLEQAAKRIVDHLNKQNQKEIA